MRLKHWIVVLLIVQSIGLELTPLTRDMNIVLLYLTVMILEWAAIVIVASIKNPIAFHALKMRWDSLQWSWRLGYIPFFGWKLIEMAAEGDRR